MKHLDLFSGIGGFALAASWVWRKEHEIHCFIEIDPFCQKVLKKHWPDVLIHGDIETYEHDGTKIDLLTGGFPCQPFSTAGKQKGKGDNRSLWPKMFKLIQTSKPTWIIAENVIGIRKMELDNILADLEDQNYTCETYNIPACAVSAPHIRKRFWVVAYLNSRGWYPQPLFCSEPQKGFCANDVDGSDAIDGGQKTWLVEPDVGRVVYGVSRKLDKCRVKALGNAIVPQVVMPIMEGIKIIDDKYNQTLEQSSLLS